MELSNEEILSILKNGDLIKKGETLKVLSYEKIKELYEIDKNIIRYIANDSVNGFTSAVRGFSNKEIIDFYNYFYDEINLVDETSFAQGFENLAYFYADQDVSGPRAENFLEARKKSLEFLEYIFVKYEDKLANIESPSLIVHLLVNMLDRGLSKALLNKFMSNNEAKIKSVISKCDHNYLFDIFEGLNSDCQKFLLDCFYDDIVNHEGFKGLCCCLHNDVLVHLCDKDIRNISKIELRHFLRKKLDDKTKSIVSMYPLEDLSNAFESWEPAECVREVEKIFRDKIVCDGEIENISEDTSLFSKVYFKNLKEMSVLIENKTITRNSEIYKEHFKIFYKYLVKSKNLGELDAAKIREIEKLFFRITKSEGLWILKKIDGISSIALVNRIGVIERWANNFSFEQLLKYNVKEHKRLCEIVKNGNPSNNQEYEPYVLKLMLLVGHKRAENILKIDNDIETLHHLVGNVHVKDIKLADNGDPILDNKFISLLFKDKDHNRIRLMLENKDSDLYKFFPRIVDEWEVIRISNKNKSLKEVIEFLKNGGVIVPPRYYRLDNSFNLIGRRNDIVLETFNLHDEMLKRVESTIPRIKGTVNGYEYEVLRYDDMEGLTVGNTTDCCFTVKGVSQTSLRHALTSENGRILTVKKNGELLAHSWLWRNGNLLCLDNIEISKKIKSVDFIEVYEDFADKVVEESISCEGNAGIRNVTVGGNLGSKYGVFGKYPCYLKNDSSHPNAIRVNELPVPIEEGLYSDAKMCQFLIKGEGNFSFYRSKFYYKDERKEVLEYNDRKKNDWDFIKLLNKKVNALRFIKDKDGKSELSKIDIRYYDKVYCNDDWYVLVDKTGVSEYFVYSNDERANEELGCVLKSLKKMQLGR